MGFFSWGGWRQSSFWNGPRPTLPAAHCKSEDKMTDRLKDPRTWTMLTALLNALLAYLRVDPQAALIVNGAIALIAFLLFGVAPLNNALRR